MPINPVQCGAVLCPARGDCMMSIYIWLTCVSINMFPFLWRTSLHQDQVGNHSGCRCVVHVPCPRSYGRNHSPSSLRMVRLDVRTHLGGETFTKVSKVGWIWGPRKFRTENETSESSGQIFDSVSQFFLCLPLSSFMCLPASCPTYFHFSLRKLLNL